MRMFAAVVAALALAAPANAARHDLFPLHPGSAGPRVAAVQWLLGGHRPSVYKLRTFKGNPNGYFGARTKSAVKRMKWRLGWPSPVTPYASQRFIRIMSGRQPRPLGYVIRATRRLEQIRRNLIAGTWPARLVAAARSQLGRPCGFDYECWGANWGPLVKQYQATTGAYRAPWCVSFQQWVREHAGYPPVANRSAGVFYLVDYARWHGWIRAQARPGYLVAFMDRLGHIGLVERVTPAGFYSLEGNASNDVLRRYHPFGERPVVFIRADAQAR